MGHHGRSSRSCCNGHGLSSCGGGGGVKLFGVHLRPPPLRKSCSMDCLLPHAASPAMASPCCSAPSTPTVLLTIDEGAEMVCSGYLSEDPLGSLQDRRKGVPWSEEEHRLFLAGLGKLGRGDWRGISRSFVTSRTPTQVASHAQKYFLRKSSICGKVKRRSSLFDMVGVGKSSSPSSSSPSLSLGSSSGELSGESARIDLNSLSINAASELPPSLPANNRGSSPGRSQFPGAVKVT